jgi:hypothetical protein
MGGIIHFLDGSVDRNTKLLFLKTFRANLSHRLVELDTMINDLEAETL